MRVLQILQAGIPLSGQDIPFAADSKIAVTAESQACPGHKATWLDLCSTDGVSRNCWNISIAKHSGPNSHSCTEASEMAIAISPSLSPRYFTQSKYKITYIVYAEFCLSGTAFSTIAFNKQDAWGQILEEGLGKVQNLSNSCGKRILPMSH